MIYIKIICYVKNLSQKIEGIYSIYRLLVNSLHFKMQLILL